MTTSNNKRQGNAAETTFLDTLARSHILAHRLPEPLRIVGKGRSGGERLCRLEADLGVDVLGILPDGTGLAAEAKSVSIASRDSALRWAPDERLRGHQGAILADYTARGGVGLVYLQRLAGHYPGGPGEAGVLWMPSALYLLPWPDANPRQQTPPRESWRWEEIEGWRVPVGVCWWDALRSAEAWNRYKTHGWKKEPAP